MAGIVWYKQGVWGDLNPGIRRGQRTIQRLAARNNKEDVYITSKRDGLHGFGTCHQEGDAFDMRPLRYTNIEEVKQTLGPGYDVVDETNHWHIEWDPK